MSSAPGTIRLLDIASARKLSAGQVITDLCSVVKELLENALDAGAGVVAIRLHRFGLDRIVVEDDGSGIAMPDFIDSSTGELLPTASTPLLESRATTKQHHQQSQAAAGVEDAGGRDADSAEPSLGFRGEALHSLAQLSDVTVESMHASYSPHTVVIGYDREQQQARLSLSRARQYPGTTVTTTNLFQNLPVRLREYEKNRRRQLLAAVHLVKQYAVSHPGLRLVLTHQEEPGSALATLVALTGSGDLARSVAEAYGGLAVSRMQRVTWSCSLVELSGFVSKVNGGGRLAADQQVFALDGRLVDVPRLAKAVQDAFVQCLPNASQRLLPAFFLQLSLTSDVAYDVNLAPNKRKVLLSQEEALVEAVHRAALHEFRTATEGITMDRQTRIAQHQQADVRATLATKQTLTPVSATAIANFAFKKKEPAEEGRQASPCCLSTVELPKLGDALYDGDAADSSASASEPEAVPLLSATSSSEESTEDGDEEEAMAASQASARSSASVRSQPGREDGAEDDAPPHRRRRSEQDIDDDCGPECEEGASAEELLVLSDATNRRREVGASIQHDIPPLCALAKTPLFAWAEASTSAAAPRGLPKAKLSNFAAQSAGELTSYFSKQSFRDMHVIGQFNHGFIVATLGVDLFVIDQHASDEKYNYERLMAQYVAKPQPLVVPVPVAMDAYEVDLAIAHAPALAQHGFRVQRGADPTKLLVCSLPVLPYDIVSAPDVVELIQQLVRYGAVTTPLRAVWHSMATKACRSSIMIGTALSHKTMRTIVDRLGELQQPWSCPHGRPTLRCIGSISEMKQNMPPPQH